LNDEKLARGLARQLIRETKAVTDMENGPFGLAIRPTLQAYHDGGVSNVVTAGLALRERIGAAGPFPCTTIVLTHPTRKRMIVETIVPRVITGREQEHLVCAGYVCDLARSELSVIETSLHTSISHHSLTRLYQRSTFGSGDVLDLLDTVTRFVTPILFGARILGWGPDTGVAVPFLDGLLLGSIEVNPLAQDEGPTLSTFSRNHTSELQMLAMPFDISTGPHRGILTIGIDTYVGATDLYPNQEAVRDELIEMQGRFDDNFHALRTGLMRGYPDQRMRDRFGSITPEICKDDLLAIGTAMTRFFETPEWERQALAHGHRAAAIRRKALH
jgi:hypothetical protein